MPNDFAVQLVKLMIENTICIVDQAEIQNLEDCDEHPVAPLVGVVDDFEAEEAVQDESQEPGLPEVGHAEVKRQHVLRDHVPYASWCRVCVQGRGRDKPHRRQPKNNQVNHRWFVPIIVTLELQRTR
jgi:hypothetical protein